MQMISEGSSAPRLSGVCVCCVLPDLLVAPPMAALGVW
jgi:hypothetical protein